MPKLIEIFQIDDKRMKLNVQSSYMRHAGGIKAVQS